MPKIDTDIGRHALGPDFGIRFRDDEVFVPAEVGQVLRGLNVRTVDEFVAMLVSFPTAIMAAMEWSLSEFEIARDKAMHQLEAKISPAMKATLRAPRFERGLGALPPRASSASKAKG